MTIRVSMKKAALAAAAGGLAMQSTLVSADTGTKFDVEQAQRPDGQLPPLHMDQICQPLDVCTMPTDDFIKDFDQDEFSGVGGKFASGMTRRADGDMGGKTPTYDEDYADRKKLDRPQQFSPVGVIFAGDIDDFDNDAQNRRPQMKFIVSGVRNDVPVDLLLVYNDRKAKPEEQILTSSVGGGNIGVPVNFDPAAAEQKDKLQIIAGVTLQPQIPMPLMGLLPDTPFGSDRGQNKLRTAVISIPVADITQMVADGRLPDEIFFQAIAAEHHADGSLDFAKAQYSDVDLFLVDVPFDGGPGDTGGKAGSFVADEGETPEPTDSFGKLTGTTTPTDPAPSDGNDGSKVTP